MCKKVYTSIRLEPSTYRWYPSDFDVCFVCVGQKVPNTPPFSVGRLRCTNIELFSTIANIEHDIYSNVIYDHTAKTSKLIVFIGPMTGLIPILVSILRDDDGGILTPSKWIEGYPNVGLIL